jgi:hypothetical protein
VEEGRANRKLLPGYKSRARGAGILVERKWLRLALNTLAKHMTSLPDDAAVSFGFDGSVLSTCCDGKLIALAGLGPPWAIRFKVAASALRRLPKRLREERVGLSIWQSRLRLGSWIYEGNPDGFRIQHDRSFENPIAGQKRLSRAFQNPAPLIRSWRAVRPNSPTRVL